MTGNAGTTVCFSVFVCVRQVLLQQWMAPEILMGQDYTYKADTYSFGIVLWEIASREAPYFGIRPDIVACQVTSNQRRPDLGRLERDTPKAYRELFCRCWAQKPEMRPEFKEIVSELKAIQDQIS